MIDISNNIQDVLHYGYLPDPEPNIYTERVFSAVSTPHHTATGSGLVEPAKRITHDVFNGHISSHPSDVTHIVPLSSGLDSRCILGFLLHSEKVSRSQIKTVTFGTPGTWDYEIPNLIAEDFNLHHTQIDLSSNRFSWDEDRMLWLHEKIGRPVKIFHAACNYLHALIPGKEVVVWSGFFGDPSVGSHYPHNPVDSWTKAKDRFADFNRATSEDLSSVSYSATDILPNEPLLSDSKLTYEEQLDFAIRQPCFIAPTVMPSNMDYVKPFVDFNWLKFWLNIPTHCKKQRKLFKAVMIDCFPNLFSYPTDNNFGLNIQASKTHKVLRRIYYGIKRRLIEKFGSRLTYPNINYINFDWEFRRDPKLRALVEPNLLELDDRLNLDFLSSKEIWDRHQSGANLGDEIRVLFSLNNYLKSYRV